MKVHSKVCAKKHWQPPFQIRKSIQVRKLGFLIGQIVCLFLHQKGNIGVANCQLDRQ